MVYGTYAMKNEMEMEGADDEEEQMQVSIEKSNHAFLVYIDFSQLHEP